MPTATRRRSRLRRGRQADREPRRVCHHALLHNAAGDPLPPPSAGRRAYPDKNGVWKYCAAYDRKPLRRDHLPRQGRPAHLNANGYFRGPRPTTRREPDRVGLLYFDGRRTIDRRRTTAPVPMTPRATGSRPPTWPDGCPRCTATATPSTAKYDEYGNNAGRLPGPDGKPISSDGYASVVDEFDDRGNVDRPGLFRPQRRADRQPRGRVPLCERLR
jgi:hypothetical protein